MNAPCRDCPERCIGCRRSCRRWKAYVEQLKHENEMLKAAGVEKVEETTKSMIEGGDEDGEGQQNPGGGDE